MAKLSTVGDDIVETKPQLKPLLGPAPRCGETQKRSL